MTTAVSLGRPAYLYKLSTLCLLLLQGFGFCANSLTLGCDCLGHIKYFDGLVSEAACSTPRTVAGASLGALSLIQQQQHLEAGPSC